MGFNPLIYKYLEQWVKTHWMINAEIVKEPLKVTKTSNEVTQHEVTI